MLDMFTLANIVCKFASSMEEKKILNYLNSCQFFYRYYKQDTTDIKCNGHNLIFYRHSRMDRSIPVFLKVVRNLIIENREAIKMNMATDLMKIEVYVSTIYIAGLSQEE